MPATATLDLSLSRVDASQPGFMTPGHAQFYRNAGFIIAENAVTPEQIESLQRDATAICRGGHGVYEGWVGPHDGQTDAERRRAPSVFFIMRFRCRGLGAKIKPKETQPSFDSTA